MPIGLAFLGCIGSFILGAIFMSIVSIAGRTDECEVCASAAAWHRLCAGLRAKGWRRITPQIVIDLAADLRREWMETPEHD